MLRENPQDAMHRNSSSQLLSPPPGRPTVIACLCLLSFILSMSSLALPAKSSADAQETWLLVDTQALTLAVMQGDSMIYTFENIAIGSNGATLDKEVSDEKTPLGDFRINEIRPSERFGQFLSIDYPSAEIAQRALRAGRITAEEHEALRQARKLGRAPPQDTGLGGHLGIHGIGEGSPEIHNAFNWTDGCIALTNEQLEELMAWVTVGTRVSIR